ncbi:MAG: tRNA threonylcarbamoyladenosine dehydratase [Verrucomicrobiota bacterium]
MDHYERRFSGIGRLYGSEGLNRVRRAHVCVIGLGGVGSWAVEALARSGIGELTLVDLDDVCISNVNRQLHALEGELGKPKVEAMARRVRAINPDCGVHPVQAFFLKSNADEILQGRFDYVLDAFDSPARKCLLIALCRERIIPVITTGASAGRRDPTAVEVTDLAFSSHDRLLQEVRKKLRTRHGFPRGESPFGVECVVSREMVVYPGKDGLVGTSPGPEPDLRLDCDTGFGTASFVTGTFGFVAAGRIIQRIAGAGGD